MQGKGLPSHSRIDAINYSGVMTLSSNNFEIPKEAMVKAYYWGAYTMREIAGYFAVHYIIVSRAVRQFEN